ncbi:MAG TPA: tetratricopeptide repeat protein [Puia sp.]|jgi:lysophospholipase L1-like esterase
MVNRQLSTPDKTGLSSGRLKWFKAIAILLPVIVLIITELFLRIFDYGHDTSLFIRYPDNKDYWVMNKYASERYFSDTVNETKGNIEPFAVKKAAGTFRIFILGESTTAGYPYFHNGSFHRWLQFRLMHEFPQLHFEVINVSLTAVNSWTVLDFGKQVINYQPDAVLIYTGHNEYYGALGIGSTSHIANNRLLVQAMLTLRKLRIVQAIQNLVSYFSGGRSGPDERENLMRRMASDQRIPYGSATYNAGIQQFHDNMDQLCRLMEEKNIPVFLSNLVSNEKDQKPLISDSCCADKEFRLADSSYRSGSFALAKRQYETAKELDVLRFRAPAAMNEIIVQLTKKYPAVHLVDTKGIFEQHSPHYILGKETLLEHVHPNLYGYALLSEAFYQSIRKANLFAVSPAREMSFAELINKMPVTGVDTLNGVYTVMMLKARWPFNEPIPADFKRGGSVQEQLAGAIAVGRIKWVDAMNELYQYSIRTKDKNTALKAAEAVMLEYPNNDTYKLFAGRLSFELGEYNDAIFYFRQAYDLHPTIANAQTLCLVYLKTDQPEQALAWIDTATAIQSNNQQIPHLRSLVREIIQLKAQGISATGDSINRKRIALDYHMAGADEAGEKYFLRIQ